MAIGPSDRDHLEKLLETVTAVVDPDQTTVYLLHVFPRGEHDELMEQLGADPTTGILGPDELAARYHDIKSPASCLSELDINYEIRGTIGDPEKEVVRVSEDINADLLFIGGEGRSPTGKAVFGDSAQQILLNAPCPVTYVRRD